MKKVLAVLLTLAMLLGAFALPVYAGEAEPEYLYRDKFEEHYASYVEQLDPDELSYYYKELYYHTDDNDETDWVLIRASFPMELPMPLYAEIANRVHYASDHSIPFCAGYGIYDVKQERFLDLTALSDQHALSDYPDLDRVYDKLGGGRLLGDMDGDNKLTCVDATIIQRCMVELQDFPADDEIGAIKDFSKGYAEACWHGKVALYYSDFNRDGSRNGLDAVCILRYLVDLPY